MPSGVTVPRSHHLNPHSTPIDASCGAAFATSVVDRASGRQAMPAFCPAGLDNGAACPGRHTGTESVSTRALQAAWLKCTLHCFLSLKMVSGLFFRSVESGYKCPAQESNFNFNLQCKQVNPAAVFSCGQVIHRGVDLAVPVLLFMYRSRENNHQTNLRYVQKLLANLLEPSGARAPGRRFQYLDPAASNQDR